MKDLTERQLSGVAELFQELGQEWFHGSASWIPSSAGPGPELQGAKESLVQYEFDVFEKNGKKGK